MKAPLQASKKVITCVLGLMCCLRGSDIARTNVCARACVCLSAQYGRVALLLGKEVAEEKAEGDDSDDVGVQERLGIRPVVVVVVVIVLVVSVRLNLDDIRRQN